MTIAEEGLAPIDAATETSVLPLQPTLEEAERLFGNGQTEEAMQYLELARQRYYESGDAASEGAVLRTLANGEFALGRAREAERFLELACERYTSANQPATAADLSLSLGDLRAKNGESKRAREAYLAGAKLYRAHDNPLGQAHAEFKLATLHATTNYDMALRHYNFAASLYDRADAGLPVDDSLRIDNPHLPENFDDCRPIEARIMARVARREADRLRTEIGPGTEEETPAAPPPPTAWRMLRGGLAFVIVPAIFIGTVFAFTRLPASPFSASQTFLMPIALVAGALSIVMARMNGVESRTIQYVGGLLVCVGVQVANAALTRSYTMPVLEQDGERAAIAAQLASLSTAANAPEGAAAQRAELSKVLAIARERGDRPGEASALQAQAAFEQRGGTSAQVIVMYTAALEIYRELGDKPKQLEVLVPLAEAHRALKQHAQAREAFRQAAELYAQQQDGRNQSKVLLAVGDLERELQRPKEARAAYGRAIELTRGADPIAEANALLHLGKLEADLHATETARKAYGEALTLSEQRNDIAGQANALQHLGELEAAEGKDSQAVALYDRALALYGMDEQHTKGRVRILHLRGDLERSRKQPALAQEYYTKALALSEEKDGGAQAAEILIPLADVTASMGQRDQARDTYIRALGRYEQTGHSEGQIMTLRRLSQLVAKDNLPLAQRYAKRAAELQESSTQERLAAH